MLEFLRKLSIKKGESILKAEVRREHKKKRNDNFAKWMRNGTCVRVHPKNIRVEFLNFAAAGASPAPLGSVRRARGARAAATTIIPIFLR